MTGEGRSQDASRLDAFDATAVDRDLAAIPYKIRFMLGTRHKEAVVGILDTCARSPALEIPSFHA